MPTPKTTRQPPQRIFENYVLTRVTAPGASITEIPDRLFEATLGDASAGFADDQISDLVEIGFDFVFDNITYRRIVVSTNGWLALADPTATVASSVQTSLLNSASYQNEGVKLTNSSNSVLLCPWFDDLRNVAQTAGQAGLSDTRPRGGYEAPSIQYNNVDFGVKIYRDVRSNEGRRTIVRWNSLSDYSSASTVLKFEAVLYENGTIEFRYVPRRNLTLTETTSGGNFIEDATVGIFANGTNRFRDFSQGLGYLDGSRQTYKYGGNTYVSSFQDAGLETYGPSWTSRPYVWRLRPASHWPGLTNFGTIFRFTPPKSRRRILPRVLLREKDSRNESSFRIFDDRRSTPFISGVIVNYPTTLLRFVGDSDVGVSERQDLFGNGDTEMFVTGAIAKSAVEQFLESRDDQRIKPFSENNRFDQGPSARNDLFYISGSGTELGEKFDTPLWSKAQISFALPVNYITSMFGTTSSLFYYNNRSSAWLQPDNTTGLTRGSDISLPTSFATNGRILEDHRGFGPIGNSLSSGSNTPSGVGGTDVVINSSFDSNQAAIALERRYTKSVRSNPEYNATNDETFTISSDRPFLIEKAVFKIPLSCGPGWFNDKTTSFMPLVSSIGSFDFAGPALTISLMNQIGTGDQIKRDLIMTATITHTNDNISSLVMSNFPSLTDEFQIRPAGYLSYASAPGALIAPLSDNTFTGSVVVKAEALVSNGVILKMSKDMVAEPSSEYPTNRIEVLNLIDQAELTLHSASTLYSLGYNIAYVDSFGSGEDLTPSGRNVLGKGFATSQGIIDGNKIRNPFYVTGSARTQISSSLAAGNHFRAVAAIPLAAHFKSPYLLLPGDKLILAISKTRPFFYSSGLGGPETSGSLAHEVDLLTGTINVTLFGSQLQLGREFHDTLPRNLKSPNIHEMIGSDPVIDQFEIASPGEYLGSVNDNFITGTLAKATIGVKGSTVITRGERGRIFSKLGARNQAAPDESDAELLTNSSKAFRLQPWWERVGTSRISSAQSNVERFWDSLMPKINDCFKADGTRIYFRNIYGLKIGVMRFNYRGGGAPYAVTQNMNWSLAYPFEPRYLHVSRQKDTNNTFIADLNFSSGTPVIMEPVQLNGLQLQYSQTRFDLPQLSEIFTAADVNLSALSLGALATGSLSSDDTLKCLFGFGDNNTYCKPITDPDGEGSNHLPTFRNVHFDAFGSGYAYGPIIRGWKYGVVSALPAYSKAYFRPGRYGQFRDMLEQRLFTKFFNSEKGTRDTISTSPVQVRFVDANGKTTKPENTQSQNLSLEATSSFPYLDGEFRNRTDINPSTQNTSFVNLTSDQFNNTSI